MGLLRKTIVIAGFVLAVSVIAASGRAQSPAPIDLGGRTITRMATDLQRPYVYALSPKMGTEQVGRLLFINTDTHTLEKSIPLGPNPTDLTVHYADGYLYVVGTGEKVLRRISLSTQTADTSVLLSTRAIVDRVNSGPAGRVYVEGDDQWVNLDIVDTADGQSSMSLWIRYGDGESDASGTIYYHCDNDISNAHITKYDMATSPIRVLARSDINGYGSRTLVLSANGERLFWQGTVYDSDLNIVQHLAEPIFATTQGGEIAFGARGYYNSRSGLKIGPLPATSTVMAEDNQQANLVYYNNQTDQVEFLDLAQMTETTSGTLQPNPADGSDVILPLPQLQWNILPAALSYDVYFGTDRTAVENADLNSPEHRMSGLTGTYSLPAPLRTENTYYWRVDTRTFAGVTKGAVWSFYTVPLRIRPSHLDLIRPLGAAPFSIDLSIESDTPGLNWQVGESIPWLETVPLSDSTTSVLSLIIDPSAVSLGVHNETLQFTAGGHSFDYPISLRIVPLNVTHLLCDPSRAMAYGLQPGQNTSDPGLLMFIDTTTDRVVDTLTLGDQPTDLDIDPSGDVLWVVNYGNQELTKVDLVSRSVEKRYPLNITGDQPSGAHYHIAAGNNHRLFIVDAQWAPNLHVFDATPGVEKFVNSVQYDGFGGIVLSPDRTVLYGWRQYGWSTGNLSSWLFSIDATTDTLAILDQGANRTLSRDPLDSPILLADSGNEIFVKKNRFSITDLSNPTATYPLQVYQVPENGGFVVTQSSILDADQGDPLLTLPFTSTVMDFCDGGERLLLFDPTTQTVKSIRPRRQLVLNLLLGLSDYSRPYMDHNGDSTIDAGDIF